MHVHIAFKDAIEAACVDDATLVKMFGKDKDGLIKANEEGEYVKMSFVIARPFIEHRMMSAVLAVAGTDTGATLFGPADMQISANTSVKTIEGHYTCHTKSVITKPQNVMVLRDIMCNGYVAGCNTTFFGYNKETKSYSVDDIRDQINARLTMANGDDVDYPSMLCFPEKWDAATQRDQVISISNRVLPWDTTNGDTRMQFPGGEEGWKAAGGKGLEGIHYGEDLRATSNQGTPSAVERGRLTWPLPPSPTHTDSQPHPACVRLHRGVDGQQLDLLPRPAPRLLAVERDLPGVGSRPGPLRPRRASRRRPLAPRRVGVARVGAQRDDRHRGGGALAARLPEAHVKRRRRRSRPRTRRARRARRERDRRERDTRETRERLTET